ncbi:MAG TPA: hypothetical protein VFJ09_05025 [Nocardioidaceae bacterium]|nr:hypothetical protein [Nocardioidaceae bacterium]
MTNIEWRDIDDPAPDARVAAVLSAAAAPVEPGPLPGEEAALAAFGAVHRRSGRNRMRSLVPFKTGLAAAVGAGVLFTGGVAAAATTGSLPDPAQQTVQTALAHVGITVPGPNEHAGDHPNEHANLKSGNAADHPTSTDGTTDETTTETNTETNTDQQDATDGQTKGSEISDLAKQDFPTGLDRGIEVSGKASNEKSQAGEDHGQAADHPTSTDQPTGDQTDSTDTEQSGDEQSSDEQSGDTEDGGDAAQSTAGTASSGHSTGGTSHRP